MCWQFCLSFCYWICECSKLPQRMLGSRYSPSCLHCLAPLNLSLVIGSDCPSKNSDPFLVNYFKSMRSSSWLVEVSSSSSLEPLLLWPLVEAFFWELTPLKPKAIKVAEMGNKIWGVVINCNSGGAHPTSTLRSMYSGYGRMSTLYQSLVPRIAHIL